MSKLRAALFSVAVVLPVSLWAGENAAPASAPQEVRVGIYILNIGSLNVQTGAFTMDFYLSLKSDQDWPPESFEFMNGRAERHEILTQAPTIRENYCWKVYRVFANLSSPIDFKRFPFDSQRLQVILEDEKLDNTKLIYVPDPNTSGFDESLFFPGWELTNSEPQAQVAEHWYRAFDETYSRYILDAGISRIKMDSFIKTFMPVLFLMLIVTSSFILNASQVITRLATLGSSLVASAMFHISISSQIPPVGYPTFADKFMVLTYFILLASFFLNIGIFVFQGQGRKEMAGKLNRWSRGIVFVGVPFLYGMLVFVML